MCFCCFTSPFARTQLIGQLIAAFSNQFDSMPRKLITALLTQPILVHDKISGRMSRFHCECAEIDIILILISVPNLTAPLNFVAPETQTCNEFLLLDEDI